MGRDSFASVDVVEVRENPRHPIFNPLMLKSSSRYCSLDLKYF